MPGSTGPMWRSGRDRIRRRRAHRRYPGWKLPDISLPLARASRTWRSARRSRRWSTAAVMRPIAWPTPMSAWSFRRIFAGRGGGLARNAVYRVAQCVRTRLCPRWRNHPDPWRHQRHRHDDDRAWRRLFGLTTIVTCGSADKCARALELGASHAIDYKTTDFVAEVARITDKSRRRSGARHGCRRLCAAQSEMPGRRWPPCHDRRAGRDPRRDQYGAT